MGSANCKSCSSNSASVQIAQTQNGKPNCDTTTAISEQPSGADYVEHDVCSVGDIQDNEMKQFEMGDSGKILLVKQNGEYSAIGTKCSHYGALLSTGALGQGRIRCPWHGACFNIKTGDIEDFPGQDAIPCYNVKVDKGKIRVRAKRSDLEANKRLKDMCKRDPANAETFVVIGAGPSGAICVETLRQEGFTGRIVFVGKEDCLPYDRVKVSKSMDFDIKKAEFRTAEFYEQYDIECMMGTEATKVEPATNSVSLSNGYVLHYDKIYVATGARAKKAQIPGAELSQVVTMRDYADSQHVIKMLNKDSHVVCLGLSFISLESAAYCTGKCAKITVIGRDSVPLRHSFGPEVGASVQKMFEDKGIEFKLQSGIVRCIEENGKLMAVELKDGTQLKCDICIMGTGSDFFTNFLKDSGVQMNKDGSIDTDEYLETNVRGIYVGGDIANAPVYCINQQKATIGHYPLAQYHGRVAAQNMVGKKTGLQAVPYFWTVLFGKSFRYSGYGVPHSIQIEGSVDDLKFVAIFFDKDDYVVGMASCQRDPIVSQYAEYMAQGKRLKKADLQTDPFYWVKLIN